MGACATKPGDLKVKGEAPLVVEDAASPAPPVVAGEEKAKPVGAPVAAEADPADASRRRSLSDLLKQDAETSDGEADQEAEKAAAAESAIAAGDAGATMGPSQAPVQAPDATEQDGTAQGLKVDDPSGDAQEAEEEKRVDPESVQVAAAAAAAPSAEESKVAGEDVSA